MKGERFMAKYVCKVCGYVHEGEAAPEACPVCKAPADKFELMAEEKAWAAEHGIILKLSTDDGFEHYDGCTDTHYHFACRKCKAVIDLEMEDIAFVNTLAAKNFSGEIEGHVAYFYGTCENCK